MNPQEPQGYERLGFNRFLERTPQVFNANDTINESISPFLSQISENGIIFDPFSDFTNQTMQALLPAISANNVQGGVIQSNNGNLQIDLNNGTLNYNDGVQNLLNVGGTNTQGTPQSLTATDSLGNTILTSQPAG